MWPQTFLLSAVCILHIKKHISPQLTVALAMNYSCSPHLGQMMQLWFATVLSATGFQWIKDFLWEIRVTFQSNTFLGTCLKKIWIIFIINRILEQKNVLLELNPGYPLRCTNTHCCQRSLGPWVQFCLWLWLTWIHSSQTCLLLSLGMNYGIWPSLKLTDC